MVETTLFDLTGKVALLTGATKGMGLAMAGALAAHGARVMVSSRKTDACEAAAAAINRAVGAERAEGMAANAGRKEDLEALVAATRERLGAIDIVIGNAGVNPYYGPIADIPDEAWDKTMATNVRSNHWLARLVVPEMAAKGSGSLIFTSSVGAFAPSTTIGVYNISKLALLGLVRNLAAEHGRKGIRANAICPGLIRTEFARALWEDPERERKTLEDVALGRLGEPEDLAGAAVFLASDASRYVTGQALTVDGGRYMWT